MYKETDNKCSFSIHSYTLRRNAGGLMPPESAMGTITAADPMVGMYMNSSSERKKTLVNPCKSSI